MALLKIHGLARFTRNPEIRYISGKDTAVAKIGLVCSEKYKEQETSAFYEAVCFGKQAEIIGQYMEKGSLIYINGKLKLEQWEQEGQKRSKHVIIIESFEFAGGKRDGKSADNKSGGFSSGGSDDFAGGGFSEDDIPFMRFDERLAW